MAMTMARSLPDSANEWWIFLGVFVLYASSRWILAWREARRAGDSHPVRAALADEGDPGTSSATPTGGFGSYRQFFGFVGSVVVVVLIAVLTEGRLRLTLLWTIAPLLVIALSYLDFRQAGKARTRA